MNSLECFKSIKEQTSSSVEPEKKKLGFFAKQQLIIINQSYKHPILKSVPSLNILRNDVLTQANISKYSVVSSSDSTDCFHPGRNNNHYYSRKRIYGGFCFALCCTSSAFWILHSYSLPCSEWAFDNSQQWSNTSVSFDFCPWNV